jgi:hypothetical protein
MIEQTATALVTTLGGDSTLTTTLGVTGVFYDLAPDEQAYPFIVISLVTAPDHYTMGRRAWTEGHWQIRAFDGDRSARRAARVMARVDALLTDQPLTVTGHTALVVRRTDTLPPVTEIDSATGLHIRAEGARYLIGVREGT